MEFKYAIVLTGGIGTGKSTTANILKLYGYEVIDADTLAHQELQNSKDEIVAVFGPSCLKNGKIDRKVLGKIVFNNEEKRQKLEEILHPKIKQQIIKLSQEKEKKKVFYFIDLPLFFEKQNYNFKKTVLVYAPKELQIKRVKQRDNLNKDDIIKRLNAQMDIEEKKKLAWKIIDNSKDLKHLTKEVEKFLKDLNADCKI